MMRSQVCFIKISFNLKDQVDPTKEYWYKYLQQDDM